MTIELIAEVTGRNKQWGALAAPVLPEETQLRMRAQSILSGGEIGQCPPLTLDQARDVLAWYQPKH